MERRKMVRMMLAVIAITLVLGATQGPASAKRIRLRLTPKVFGFQPIVLCVAVPQEAGCPLVTNN